MHGIARTPQEWESLVSDSFVPLAVDAVRPGPKGFHGAVASRSTGNGTTVHRVTAHGSRLRRNLQAAPSTEPSALFVMHRAGEGRVEQFGRRAIQRPGEFVLYLSDAPYTLDFVAAIDETVVHVPLTSLRTPRERLGELSSRTFHADVHLNGLRAYAGALLESSAAEHDSRDTRLGSTVAYLADTALMNLLGVNAPAPTDEIVRARAERCIALHARDPKLSPDSVADMLSISRRRLYVAFETMGSSPAGLIRQARTDLAIQILESEPSATVTSVWQRAGFSDHRTFLRAIVGRTGMTPSEWQRQRAGMRAPALRSPDD